MSETAEIQEREEAVLVERNGLPECLSTPELRREFILSLEDALKKTPGAVIGDNDIYPVRHMFADGCYVREIFIPKGTLLTGKLHKHCHPNFLLAGVVSMITEDGGTVLMSAPQSIISPAGCKRAIYTHMDTIWTTVHVTNETDLKKIEEETIAESYDKLIEFRGVS